MERNNQKSVDKILELRALELARVTTQEKLSDEESLDIVEFIISDETYGMELKYIQEVFPLSDFTQLHSTPTFVVGIVNLRGQVLSIINLMNFLGIESRGITNLNTVIMLQSSDMEFGILIDEIVGVKRVDSHTLQSSFPTLTDHQASFLIGVTPERCIILDGGKLLTSPDVIVEDIVE